MASCERCVHLSTEVERLNAQKKTLKHLLNVVDASKKQKAQMVDQLLQLIKSKDEYYKKEKMKIKEVAYKVKNVTTESVLKNVPKQIDELSALYVNKIAEIKKYTKATDEARIAKQELESKTLELDGNKMYVKQLIADAEQVRVENKTLSDSLSLVKQDLAKMVLKQKKVEKESLKLKDIHAYKLRVEAGVRKALDRLASRDPNSTKSCMKILKNLMEFFSAEPLFTKPPESSRMSETRKSLNSPHSMSSGYSSASASPWSTPYNSPQETEINTQFTCSFTPDGEFRLAPIMPQTNSQSNSTLSQGSSSSTSLSTNPAPSTSNSETWTKKLSLQNPVTSWSMCDSSDDEINESDVHDENERIFTPIENKDKMNLTSQHAQDRESEISSHSKKNNIDTDEINTLSLNEREITLTQSSLSSNNDCTESDSDSEVENEELVENKPVEILQLPDIGLSESRQEQEQSNDQHNKINKPSSNITNKNSKQHFIDSENPVDQKNTSLFSPKMLPPDHWSIKNKNRKDIEKEITRAAQLLEKTGSHKKTLTVENKISSSNSLPLSEMSDICVTEASFKEKNTHIEKNKTPKKSVSSDKNEVPTAKVNPKRKSNSPQMVTHLVSLEISSKEEDIESVITEDLNVSDSDSDCSENVVRTEEVMQIFKDMENMKTIDLISNFDPTSPCKNYRRCRHDSLVSNTESQKSVPNTCEPDKLVPEKLNFVSYSVEKTLQDIQSVVDHKIDLRKETLPKEKVEKNRCNDAKQTKSNAMKDGTLKNEDSRLNYSLRRSTRSMNENSRKSPSSPTEKLNQSSEFNTKENNSTSKNKKIKKSISKKDSCEEISFVTSKSTTGNYSLRRKSLGNVLPYTSEEKSEAHISNTCPQRRTRSSSKWDQRDADNASKETKKVPHNILEKSVEIINKIEKDSVMKDQQYDKDQKVADNSSLSKKLSNGRKSTQSNKVIQEENQCRIGIKRKSSTTDGINENPGFVTKKSPLNCYSFRRRSTGNDSPEIISLSNKRRTRRSIASVEMIDDAIGSSDDISKLKQELKQIYQKIDEMCVPKKHEKTKESENHVRDQNFASMQSECNDTPIEVVSEKNCNNKELQDFHDNQNIDNNCTYVEKSQVLSFNDNTGDRLGVTSQLKSSQCPAPEKKDNPGILEPYVAETTNSSKKSEESVVNMSEADDFITKSKDDENNKIGSLKQNIPIMDSIINNTNAENVSSTQIQNLEEYKVKNKKPVNDLVEQKLPSKSVIGLSDQKKDVNENPFSGLLSVDNFNQMSENIMNNPKDFRSSVELEEGLKIDSNDMKTQETLHQNIKGINSKSENLITSNSNDKCVVNNEISSLASKTDNKCAVNNDIFNLVTQENPSIKNNQKHTIVKNTTTIINLEPFETKHPWIKGSNIHKPPNPVVNSKKVNVILRKMNFLKKFPFIDAIPATPPLKITKETGFKNFDSYNNPDVSPSEQEPLLFSTQETLNMSLSDSISDQTKTKPITDVNIPLSSNNNLQPKDVVQGNKVHVSKKDEFEVEEENITEKNDTAILRASVTDNDLTNKNAQSSCRQLNINVPNKRTDAVSSSPSLFKNPNFCGPPKIIASNRSLQPSKSKFPKCIEEKLALLAQNKNLPIYAITPLTNLTHNRTNAINPTKTNVQVLNPLTSGERKLDGMEVKTNSQNQVGLNNMEGEISFLIGGQSRDAINNPIQLTINETVMKENVTIQASMKTDNNIILPTFSFYNSGNTSSKRKCEDTESGGSDKRLKADNETHAVTIVQNLSPKKKDFKLIEHSIYYLEKTISKENEATETIKSSKITKKLNFIMHNKNRNMFDKNLTDFIKELETYPFDILSRRIIALLEKDMHLEHHKHMDTLQSQICCIILKLMMERPDFAPTFMKTLHETICLHSETILLTNLYALLHVYVFLCRWRNDPATLLSLLYDSIYFHKKRMLNIFDGILTKWPSVYPVESTCILIRVMSALVLNQQTPQRFLNAKQCSLKTKQLLRVTYRYREQFTLVGLLEELMAMLKSGRPCCYPSARHLTLKSTLNFQGQGLDESSLSRFCCVQKAIILLAKHWSPASDVHLVVLEKNLVALFRTSLDGGQLHVAASCAQLIGMIAKAFPRASSLMPVLAVLDALESGLLHPAALTSPPTRQAIARAVACLACHNTDRCLDILAAVSWTDAEVSDLSAHVSALLITAKDLDWWKAFLERAKCSSEVTAK